MRGNPNDDSSSFVNNSSSLANDSSVFENNIRKTTEEESNYLNYSSDNNNHESVLILSTIQMQSIFKFTKRPLSDYCDSQALVCSRASRSVMNLFQQVTLLNVSMCSF